MQFDAKSAVFSNFETTKLSHHTLKHFFVMPEDSKESFCTTEVKNKSNFLLQSLNLRRKNSSVCREKERKNRVPNFKSTKKSVPDSQSKFKKLLSFYSWGMTNTPKAYI